MIFQIVLLLLIAFVLGCVTGHWLRGYSASRRTSRATTERQPAERKPTQPMKARSAPKAPPKAARSKAAAPRRDDLKLLSGVGPALEKKLNKSGVQRFEQIAKWTKADIARFDEQLNFKGRIEREGWVAQAKVLAKGGETEFSKKARQGKAARSAGKARSAR